MEYGDQFKKSVFGGFKRQDVLQCIGEMNARSTEALTTEQEENVRLRNEAAQLKELLAAQQTQNAELSAKNEKRTQDFIECEEKINRAIATNNEMKERSETLQKELQSLKAANSELGVMKSLLEENNRALKTRIEELEEAQQGRKASFEIGEMMLEAKKTADGIINRASEKADAMQSTVEVQTADISARLSEIRVQLSTASTDFRSYSGSIIKSLEEMQRAIDDSRARLKSPAAPKPAAPAPAPKPEPKSSPYSFLQRK